MKSKNQKEFEFLQKAFAKYQCERNEEDSDFATETPSRDFFEFQLQEILKKSKRIRPAPWKNLPKRAVALAAALLIFFSTATVFAVRPAVVSFISDFCEDSETSPLLPGLVKNGTKNILETPSRIIFDGTGTPQNYIFYYNKADGKAYVYCCEPFCDHSGEKCLANPYIAGETLTDFELRYTFFINDRFYTVTPYGQIYSFAFDGSDLKIEYGKESYPREENKGYQNIWSPKFNAYDKYIYIPMRADEEGNPHTLRFNTETKEMEDLTEKTGNYVNVYFFYNGEVYGTDSRYINWFKTDLELKKMTPIEAQPTTDKFYGSLFFEEAYDDSTDYAKIKVVGLRAYDVATGEEKIFTHEMLGFEDTARYVIVGTDENYVYFYERKSTLVGTCIDRWGDKKIYYKSNDGKLYRVRHDGTECTCIYDNPSSEFTFNSNLWRSIVFGDKILIQAVYIGIRNNEVIEWNNGWKIGTIGPDGKIEKFENVEFVY